jgi:hypothetical protein
MSRLVDELRVRGLHVPNEKRPLAEIESGRIDDVRKSLPGDITQETLAESIHTDVRHRKHKDVDHIDVKTFQNWNGNPGQIKSVDAEKLVDCFTKQFMTSYAIMENVARSLVLDELTKDVDRQNADEAYIRGMGCILSNATDYLLSDELESLTSELETLCAHVRQAIKAERQDQIAQDDLRAFLDVLKKWDYMRRKKNGDTEGYREAGKDLDSAIATFSSLTEKAPDAQ